MTASASLYWLPSKPDWRECLKAWVAEEEPAFDTAMNLANCQIDFLKTNMLDKAVRDAFSGGPPSSLGSKPIRLAILGSSTFAHLHSGIRVAGLRRGIWIEIYENDYGQYLQELNDPESGFSKYAANTVLFSFDAFHMSAGLHAEMTVSEAEHYLSDALSRVRQCWADARKHFRGRIIQQTILPCFPQLMGNNELRLPGSRHRFVAMFNQMIRGLAEQDDVDILAIDDAAVRYGLLSIHSPALWHRSKQEITPGAAPIYGDLVGRLIAAHQGKSSKCLVMDLDNTLWGGVIGDDGPEGIVLGQGNALGEGFAAMQEYAKELSRRGVILAVCSKNDETNALEPFERHPEMVLKRVDISSFVTNWNDKATNIRKIATELNIGLDSLVFIDDNPMERDLVRQELPMVRVPEITEDPASFPLCLADAGYFEGVVVTEEDRERTKQYVGNKLRDELKSSVTDIASFLEGLQMTLVCRKFDRLGLKRIVQLINKTNQFNLRTKRYTEEEILEFMANENAVGLQLRLIDRFGDNGIIGIVMGVKDGDAMLIDSWLMSCRVLGRQVETATLNALATEAIAMNARQLIGEFKPSSKNAMVRDHYEKLGFKPLSEESGGTVRHVFDLDAFELRETFINVEIEK